MLLLCSGGHSLEPLADMTNVAIYICELTPGCQPLQWLTKAAASAMRRSRWAGRTDCAAA